MKRIIMLLGCTVMLAGALCGQQHETARTSLNAKGLQFIEKFVQKQMKQKKIPGLAIAVVDQGQVVMAKGYGVRNVDTGEPVDQHTLFHIASTHKNITAMLLATLVDTGQVNWTSTIGEIRPDLSFEDRDLRQVTVRQLATLTSGITGEDEDNFWDDYGDEAKPQAVFEFLETLLLECEPGTKFNYSNLSASLGGYLAVYAANGNTNDLNAGYSELLKKRILDPVGMTASTIFVSEARASGNYSASHYREKRHNVVAKSYDRDDDPLAPSGSLKSNAVDMAGYLITQLNEGIAPNGERVVSAANLNQTWQSTRVSKREHYGMGWVERRIARDRVLSHEGAYDNFTSVLVMLPEKKVGMVILANTERVGKLLVQAPKILVKAIRKSSK